MVHRRAPRLVHTASDLVAGQVGPASRHGAGWTSSTSRRPSLPSWRSKERGEDPSRRSTGFAPSTPIKGQRCLERPRGRSEASRGRSRESSRSVSSCQRMRSTPRSAWSLVAGLCAQRLTPKRTMAHLGGLLLPDDTLPYRSTRRGSLTGEEPNTWRSRCRSSRSRATFLTPWRRRQATQEATPGSQTGRSSRRRTSRYSGSSPRSTSSRTAARNWR